MAVFRQTYKVIEQGVGEVNIYFNFADNIANLLETDDVYRCDFVKFENINKKIDIDGGVVESELQFSFNSVDLRHNSGFRDFITSPNPKFVSVCFGVLNAANIVFMGVVQNDYELEDYVWASNPYETDLLEQSTWNMTAKPYQVEMISKYSVKDLADEIDNDWKTANVQHRQGYFYKTKNGSNYSVKVLDLVQLEVALQGLADVLGAKLTADYSEISFTFSNVNLPFVCHPARWQLWSYKNTKTRLVQPSWFGEENGSPFKVYEDDFYWAKLIFDDPSANTAPLYISGRLLYAMDNEPFPQKAKADRWSKYDDFYELISALAKALGIYVSFEFTSQTELNIRFISPQDILGNEYVYIPDAESSRLSVTAEEIEKQDEYIARSFYLANEGADYYTRSMGEKVGDTPATLVYSSDKDVQEASGLLPLSISQTICSMESIWDKYADTSALYYEAGLPHSHGLFKDDNIASIANDGAAGITTALFIPVGKYAGDPSAEFQTEPFYTNVAAIRTNYNGTEKTYASMTDWFKDKLALQRFVYKYERDIEVPFVFGFAYDNAGIAKGWKALELGKKMLINGNDYIVTEIEYNFADHKTALKLNSQSAFAFEIPTASATNEIELNFNSKFNPLHKQNKTVGAGVAYNTIATGEAVALRDDGLIERAKSNSEHSNKIIGVALNSATAGSHIVYQKAGEAYTPDGFTDLTEGQLVYVRLNTDIYPSQPNINLTPLTTKNANEDLYAIMGVATSKDKYFLNIKNYIID